jgi:hypothetical protein
MLDTSPPKKSLGDVCGYARDPAAGVVLLAHPQAGAGLQKLWPLLGRLAQRQEQPLLAVHEVVPVVRRQLELLAHEDGVLRTGLFAEAAEDAPEHMDLVHLGIAFPMGDPLLVGVLGGLDVDRVGRAGDGAQLAPYAALQPVLVLDQDVPAAIAGRQGQPLFRVRHRGRLAKDVLEGRGQSLGQLGEHVRSSLRSSLGVQSPRSEVQGRRAPSA